MNFNQYMSKSHRNSLAKETTVAVMTTVYQQPRCELRTCGTYCNSTRTSYCNLPYYCCISNDGHEMLLQSERV